MKTGSKFIAALLGAVALAATTPAALAFEQIAEKVVTDRIDLDVIHLPGPRRFGRVKVCVYDNPVAFHDFDIFFRNGGHQDVAIRARINPGGCTRNIDLVGGRRNLTRIQFLYEETSWFIGRARVRVFAD